MKCDGMVFLGGNDAVLVAVTLPTGQSVKRCVQCLYLTNHCCYTAPVCSFISSDPKRRDLRLQDNRKNACTGVSTSYRAGEEPALVPVPAPVPAPVAAPTPAPLDFTSFVLGVIATVIAYIVSILFGAAFDEQSDEAAATTEVKSGVKADVYGDRWVF